MLRIDKILLKFRHEQNRKDKTNSVDNFRFKPLGLFDL